MSSLGHAGSWRHWPNLPNSSFLLGGNIGYLNQKENFDTNFTTAFVGGVPVSYLKERISETERSFGILAGWQYHCYRWMFGIEGDVNFQTLGSDDTTRSFAFAGPTGTDFYSGTVRYHRGNIFALTGRLGWFVTPGFMPYLRLGAQISRDEAQYQAGVAFNTGNTVVVLPDFSSKKQDVWGAVGALGVELPTFIGASTFRFEYMHVRTERVEIIDTVAPIIGTHRFRSPETNEIRASFVWNFI
jgi:hypothetical protein